MDDARLGEVARLLRDDEDVGPGAVVTPHVIEVTLPARLVAAELDGRGWHVSVSSTETGDVLLSERLDADADTRAVLARVRRLAARYRAPWPVPTDADTARGILAKWAARLGPAFDIDTPGTTYRDRDRLDEAMAAQYDADIDAVFAVCEADGLDPYAMAEALLPAGTPAPALDAPRVARRLARIAARSDGDDVDALRAAIDLFRAYGLISDPL